MICVSNIRKSTRDSIQCIYYALNNFHIKCVSISLCHLCIPQQNRTTKMYRYTGILTIYCSYYIHNSFESGRILRSYMPRAAALATKRDCNIQTIRWNAVSKITITTCVVTHTQTHTHIFTSTAVFLLSWVIFFLFSF